jgi:translation initiation factor 4E
MSSLTFKELQESDSEDEFIEVTNKRVNKTAKKEQQISSEETDSNDSNDSNESSNSDSQYYVLNKVELEKLGYFKKFNSDWNLWYHHELNNWRIDGYRKIFHVKNIKDYWDLHNNIDCLGGITNQHFFLMRSNILPIWEDSSNRNGGSWSIKLNDISNVYNIWLKLSLMMVGETILKDDAALESKLVVGLSINLRNSNICIIKIWNNDSNMSSIKLLNDDIIKEFGYNIIYKKNIVEY